MTHSLPHTLANPRIGSVWPEFPDHCMSVFGTQIFWQCRTLRELIEVGIRMPDIVGVRAAYEVQRRAWPGTTVRQVTSGAYRMATGGSLGSGDGVSSPGWPSSGLAGRESPIRAASASAPPPLKVKGGPRVVHARVRVRPAAVRGAARRVPRRTRPPGAHRGTGRPWRGTVPQHGAAVQPSGGEAATPRCRG